MATQSSATPGSGYGNAYIDSLVGGAQWVGGTVTYSLVPSGLYWTDPNFNLYDVPTQAWSSNEQSMVRTIMSSFANVSGITFSDIGSANYSSANMYEVKIGTIANDGSSIILGYHYFPNGAVSPLPGVFQTDYAWASTPGSSAWNTVLHELGHGIGLSHPHDGGSESDATLFPGVTSSSSLGTNSQNQGVYTTMSYNDGYNVTGATTSYGHAITPMAFDIAALQKIYGVNNSYNTGNNTYYLPTANVAGTGWSCIWDTGGTDTISNAGSSIGSQIALIDAPLTGTYAGGYISYASERSIAGGYTIANSVTIENAIGGSGNDLILANSVSNRMEGGAGTDKVQMFLNTTDLTKYGLSSDGRVAFIQSSAGGNDVLIDIETLKFNNTETVNIATFMAGHPLYLSNLPDAVDSQSLPDVYSGPVTYLQYYKYGSSANDIVYGGSTNDFINLLGGDDAAHGNEGDDIIDGGTGSNFLSGEGGSDNFYLDSRGGTVTWGTITDFVPGVDRLDIWGWRPGVSNLVRTVANDGAVGWTGATFHYDMDGNSVIDTSVSFTGLSLSQIRSPSVGTSPAGDVYLGFR